MWMKLLRSRLFAFYSIHLYSSFLLVIPVPSTNGQTSSAVPSLSSIEEGRPKPGKGVSQSMLLIDAHPADEPFEEFFAEGLVDGTQRQAEGVEEGQLGEEGPEEEEHVHGFIKNELAPTMAQKSGATVLSTTKLPIGNESITPDPVTSVPMPNGRVKEPSEGLDVPSDFPAELAPQQLCPASTEMPTFLRHQWMASGQQATNGMMAANFVRKMDSLEACARLCRDNVEPFGGRHFGCHGFTYLSHKNAKKNICEFFDDHLAAALEKKPPIGTQKSGHSLAEMPMASAKNYFERLCLHLSTRCSRFPFAFEVYPRRSFVGIEPVQSEEVDDRKRCLEFCLQNERCRSVDFDTENLTCHLYAHTQHWTLGANDEKGLVGTLVDSVDLDHYENTCLLDLDRCGTRHLAFVLVRNAELPGFSVGLGKLSISVCLTRCLDSPPAFCRSVQFRAPTSECFLGTERPQAPIPSDEMDIFEPICLPDPPSTSTLECLGEHVFERIPNMELRAEGEVKVAEGTDIPGLPLEDCLDACILDETCQSLNYRAASPAEEEDGEVPAQCRLFTFTRADNRTLPVLIQGVDFYEMACSRIFFASANSANKSASGQMEGVPPKKKLDGKEEKKPKERERITLESFVASQSVSGAQGKSTTLGTRPVLNQQEGLDTPGTASTPRELNSTASGAGQSCVSSKSAMLLDRGRVLRMEHRLQHHVNVRNLEQCQRICVQAKAFRCATFAYSQKSRDCLLSSTIVSNETSEYTLMTQKNQNFELYAVREELKCVEVETVKTTALIETTAQTTAKMPVPTSAEGLTSIRAKAEEIGSTKTVETSSSSTSGSEGTQTTTSVPILASNLTSAHAVEENGTAQSTVSSSTPSQMPPMTTVDSNTNDEQQQKQQENNHLLESSEHKARLSPHQVHASAFCDSQGVNVTFRLIDGNHYSGVVYAADRFSQCRLFVDGQNGFSFFVNRPNRHQQQNWCNAQEIEGQMSVMLVVSNDVGVPLEVTTKEDLFFYISCNFAGPSGPVRPEGIVVSGLGIGAELQRLQQHMAHMEVGEGKRKGGAGGGGGEDKRVKLQIVRNGEPVSNVYIGEHLVAIVESNDLEAGTFRVAECNATRVPTSGERLQQEDLLKSSSGNSIPLLDRRGCSLLPQIMGNMRPVAGHLEAPLTAFRIDGSSELDIICSVIICRGHCTQQAEHCENNSGRFGRMSGKLQLPQISIQQGPEAGDEEGDKITVDQRIHVLVMKEGQDKAVDQPGPLEDLAREGGHKKQQVQLDQLQKKRLDLAKVAFEEGQVDLGVEEGGRAEVLLEAGAPNFVGGSSYKSSNGEICLNALLLLLLGMLFVLAIAALFVSLLGHWCRRKNRQSNFYPTSTELSSHHFHIPRILDRAYMG